MREGGVTIGAGRVIECTLYQKVAKTPGSNVAAKGAKKKV
jgi:hypothetical protein